MDPDYTEVLSHQEQLISGTLASVLKKNYLGMNAIEMHLNVRATVLIYNFQNLKNVSK